MKLYQEIAAVAGTFSGKLGVSAINLSSGERLDFNAADSFPPASTVKLPVLYEIWRGAAAGEWDLEQKLTLRSSHKVAGSGVLLDLSDGLRLSVRDTAVLMIVVSDNTATNMLLDLCGVDAVNRSVAALGIAGVRINRKIGVDLDRPLGEATPAGMADLMHRIATGSLVSPEACSDLLEILERQKHKEFTNRYIPETDAEEGEPAVRIASKSGWVRGVRNDVALIHAPRASYILSMFSKDCRDRRYYHDNEGALTLARVSRAVYQAWGAPA